MSIRKPELGVKRIFPLVPQIRSINDAERTIEFVASTEAIDRYGDIIRVDGWKLENYLKNPIFLFGHKSTEPPIGRALAVVKEFGDKPLLVHKIQFADKDEYPFASTIYKLYKGGYMNAVSVGFLPIKFKPRMDEEGHMLGWEYQEQELLELSAVPVPANPEALGRAVQKGIVQESDITALRALCGDENPAYINLIPGVTYAVDESAPSDGAASRLKPTERLEQFCSEGRELAARFERKLDIISHDVRQILGKNEQKAEHQTIKTETAKCETCGKDLEAGKDGSWFYCQRVFKPELEEIVPTDQTAEAFYESIVEGANEAVPVTPATERIINEAFENKVLDELADIRIGLDALTDIAIELEEKLAGNTVPTATTEKMLCPYREEEHAPDDYPWDAAAEMAKQDSPDGWKRMCTVIVGDAENKTSYKLPHHRGSDFATVRRGVGNALARLEQTDMPEEDRPGARRHLMRHRAEFVPEESIEAAETFERNLEALGLIYRTAEQIGSADLRDYAEKLTEGLIDANCPAETVQKTEQVDAQVEQAPEVIGSVEEFMRRIVKKS